MTAAVARLNFLGYILHILKSLQLLFCINFNILKNKMIFEQGYDRLVRILTFSTTYNYQWCFKNIIKKSRSNYLDYRMTNGYLGEVYSSQTPIHTVRFSQVYVHRNYLEKIFTDSLVIYSESVKIFSKEYFTTNSCGLCCLVSVTFIPGFVMFMD